MNKSNLKKLVGIGIVLLFVLSTCTPLTGGTSKNIDSEILASDVGNNLQAQEAVVTCFTYGIGQKDIEQKVMMTSDEAELILDKINNYAKLIAQDSLSTEAADLQQEIITFAAEYGLVPQETSYQIKQMQLPQQRLLPKIASGPMSQADEWFCNYAAAGEGSSTPVIILPRLIPILLTPIPRVFYKWSAKIGYSSCGGLRSGTGFYAYGEQSGIALGFWGIGFSVFLPPVMAFGIIGYALYCKVEAQNLELWPPNYPPDINAVYPLDGAQNIPISTAELSFYIDDYENEMMSYSVTTDPNIGSGNGNLKPDGTYTVPVFGLEGSEEYTWTVQVSDGPNTVVETYIFSTESVAPIVSDPDPPDDESFVPITLSELRFYIRDPQGDLMDFTVETSPDIGSSSGIGVTDGFYSTPVTNLDHTTEYIWYVNVTDGIHWKHESFSFQTEPIMIFDPFMEGWLYRKNITIEQSKIAGDANDFSVLISIVDSDLKDKAQSDGDDILFMDDEGIAQRLWHEIEQYDPTSGKLVCWVKLPHLSTTNENIFYLYYGNGGSSSQQFPEQVWNDHYMAVWHLHENPIDPIKDSTKNNNDGSSYGGMTTANLVLGKTGIAMEFDGLDDYIAISDSSSLKPEDVTMSIWYKPYAQGAGGYVVSKSSFDYWGNSDGHTYGFAAYTHIKAQFERDTSQQQDIAGSHSLIPNQWQFLTLSYDEDTATGNLYVNAMLNGSVSPCHSTVLWYHKPWDFLIGASKGGTGSGKIPTTFHNCALDEIRVSNIALGSEWLLTEYHNQNNPNTFYIIGPEETGP